MGKISIRILISTLVVAVLTLGLAAPVAAFEERPGDKVVISKDEVVNDDLYIGATKFTLDGTVNGDILVVGESITVNGNVDGDVMAAGKTVIINGNVTGSVRIAGAVLFIGENAKIGRDVIAAGASMETRKGSTIKQDAVIFAAQGLLGGDIARNVKISAGGAEFRGNVGGNVEAEVGDAKGGIHGPMFFSPDSPIPVPNVKGGLSIDPAAKIGGKLTYTSAGELPIPDGVVAGAVNHVEPEVTPVVQPSANELVMAAILLTIRRIVTLIIFGLLLGWLFPAFIKSNMELVRTAPLPSLGWGLVLIAGFFFASLILVIATIIGALLFSTLTLNSLSVTAVFLGLLGLFILILGSLLAVIFIAPIIVSSLGGKLILTKIKPELAEHWVLPLVMGVVIFSLIEAIPCIGVVIAFVLSMFGLGALWTYGSTLVAKKPAV